MKNHFAIFIITNKLKEMLYDKEFYKNSPFLYMITPLKKSFDAIGEHEVVQSELDEMKVSAYKDYVYFPYSEVLISMVTFTESD